jgi:anthranilate synthase component 1
LDEKGLLFNYQGGYMLQSSPTLQSHQAEFVVVKELPADLETPVSVYLKLMGHGPSFLLESVTGGEQVARYSFIGVGPSRAFVLREGALQCFSAEGSGGQLYPSLVEDCPSGVVEDPLAALRKEILPYRRPALPGLPRFSGGLAGYWSYEMMRYFEPAVALQPHPELPEAIFLMADTLVAFDHAFGKLLLIANLRAEQGAGAITDRQNGNLGRAQREAEGRLEILVERLSQPLPELPAGSKPPAVALRSNLSRDDFYAAVEQAREHIAAGDIFQVVLSQRLSRETSAHPFQIYRALRRLNPSPYMFYFDFDRLVGDTPLRLIGASPEVHVRLEGRKASLRPIAGTRPRGGTAREDVLLEGELLADPKERAEHVMLVDLGRNDLGRVCEYGSVQAMEFMTVERYSHVMHIVSQVEGQLKDGLDGLDLLRATFPAGTVSGAPKIRAMQIIDDLEPGPRGPYAGAVGYLSYDGALDTCIAIRTLVMHGQTVSVQAGAGVVADSTPEGEYQETLNKARALAVAIEQAEAL